MGAAWDPSDTLAAELERVAVTNRTAGYANALLVVDIGDVLVLGPPSDDPRRKWTGTEDELLQLLGRLEDGAGPAALWALLDA